MHLEGNNSLGDFSMPRVSGGFSTPKSIGAISTSGGFWAIGTPWEQLGCCHHPWGVWGICTPAASMSVYMLIWPSGHCNGTIGHLILHVSLRPLGVMSVDGPFPTSPRVIFCHVMCVRNMHENSIFQMIQVCHKSFVSVCF